jgi:hypothetical protein
MSNPDGAATRGHTCSHNSDAALRPMNRKRQDADIDELGR